MFLTDDVGSERLGSGGERIDGREERLLGERTLENDGGVQVSEGVGGSRVGQVVRRHVNGLDGSDGTFVSRGDPLLETGHFLGEGRLVTHGGRRPAEQRGHFGSGLGETEDVIDEEQHVLVVLVAEMLGHGEGGERDAETGARRLVHLTVAKRNLRAFREDRVAAVVEFRMALFVLLGGDNAGLDHFPVKVVAFTGPLTDTGEDGETPVCFRDVVDELHDDDGLADAGTTEHAAFATLEQRADEVDDFDTRGENFGVSGLLGQRGSGTVDRRAEIRIGDRHVFVHEVAGDVEDPAENLLSNRNRDRLAEVGEGHAALETVRGGHGDRTHPTVAQMLLHFEHELGIHAVEDVLDLQRVVNFRQLGCLGEVGVDDGADDLDDSSLVAHGKKS